MNRDFICMKMKLMINKQLWQFFFLWKAFVRETTRDFVLRVNKSYVPFTCKFPMVMHFVLILHKCCRSENNFYVSNYD